MVYFPVMKYSFLYYRHSAKMLHFHFKFLYALAGLYTFIVDKCGAYAVMRTRRKIYSIVYIIVMSLIMTTGLIHRISLIEEVDELFNFLFTFTYSCVNVIGQLTIVSFACKADLYVVLVNRIDAFDKELKKLHVVVWNTFPFWILIGHGPLGPLVFYSMYIADRSFEKKVFEVFCVVIPILSRSLMIFTVIALLLGLWQRCQGINLFLKELDDALLEDNINDSVIIARNKSKLSSEQKATDILTNVTVLLQQLVEFTELIKDVFSVIIFMNLAFLIFVISGAAMIYFYNGIITELSMLESVMAVIIYVVPTLELYILCFLLETETRNIYITVGQLNIYYLTPKLAFMKNTLLLQGLHSKVDMNLYGIIPLRPAIFLKQLDVCKTILLLFLQYNKIQTQPA